jgi:hypothetical protein
MRIRNAFLVLASTLALGTTQAAGFKEQPPEGVRLSGTWTIDPRRSDDPVKAIERAEKAEMAKQRQLEDRNRGTSDSPWGRDDGRVGGMPSDRDGRSDPFPDRSGPFPGGRDRGVDIDPTGREASVVLGGTGRRRTATDEFLLALDPNPQTLTILDSQRRVLVSEDKLETDCTAGEAQPIADAFGDGERQCGWRGRAWVIETTRIERFKRTDRFELSGDGRVIVYTSTVSGKRIPTIKVSRTYTLMPSTSN